MIQDISITHEQNIMSYNISLYVVKRAYHPELLSDIKEMQQKWVATDRNDRYTVN